MSQDQESSIGGMTWVINMKTEWWTIIQKKPTND
jgi:hypothetical protein